MKFGPGSTNWATVSPFISWNSLSLVMFIMSMLLSLKRRWSLQRPTNTAVPPSAFPTKAASSSLEHLPHSDGEEATELKKINAHLLSELGFVRGVTHTEYIRSHADGRYYFLETAARVGGANIAETVQAATGVNLWAEWAKIEVAQARKETYQPPENRQNYAGILVCLARQEWPDMSAYQDPEIVWRIDKKQHAGVIIASPDPNRIETLLEEYGRRFAQDFLAIGKIKEAKRTA